MKKDKPETMRCNRCDRELPLSAFPRNKAAKYGVSKPCKSCMREYVAERTTKKKPWDFNMITGFEVTTTRPTRINWRTSTVKLADG